MRFALEGMLRSSQRPARTVDRATLVDLRPGTPASGSRAIHLELNELLFAAGGLKLDHARSAFADVAGEWRSGLSREAT